MIRFDADGKVSLTVHSTDELIEVERALDTAVWALLNFTTFKGIEKCYADHARDALRKIGALPPTDPA